MGHALNKKTDWHPSSVHISNQSTDAFLRYKLKKKTKKLLNEKIQNISSKPVTLISWSLWTWHAINNIFDWYSYHISRDELYPLMYT